MQNVKAPQSRPDSALVTDVFHGLEADSISSVLVFLGGLGC